MKGGNKQLGDIGKQSPKTTEIGWGAGKSHCIMGKETQVIGDEPATAPALLHSEDVVGVDGGHWETPACGVWSVGRVWG